MTTCFSLLDCFSACKTIQELPVIQLARHVDLFHLVITNNWRPETLSLSCGLTPPIKPTNHFQPSCSIQNLKRVTALWSGSNKSFFSTHGMIFIQQFLTQDTHKIEKNSKSALGINHWFFGIPQTKDFFPNT
jgi:hypothetical protein